VSLWGGVVTDPLFLLVVRVLRVIGKVYGAEFSHNKVFVTFAYREKKYSIPRGFPLSFTT